MQSLLLLFAVLVGFFQQINDLFDRLGKQDVLDNYITKNTSSLESNVLLIVGFLILLSVIAVLSSLVRVVLRHFNLTVYVKNSALEIYQGLITKKSVILKKDKVQHITISHNPIKKKLGISFITFKQAISGKVKKKQDKVIKIVGCKVIQVSAIKDLLFPDKNFDDLAQNFSDSYFRVRLYLRCVFILIIINMGLYLGLGNSSIFG